MEKIIYWVLTIAMLTLTFLTIILTALFVGALLTP